MTEIHITDNVMIYNDMPYSWITGKDQPRWHKKVYFMWINRWNLCKVLYKKLKTHKGCKWYKLNYKHNLRLKRVQS